MNKQNQSELKVLWPVDVFSENPSIQRTAAIAIKTLSSHYPSIQIQPIYLYATYAFDMTVTTRVHLKRDNMGHIGKKIKDSADSRLDKILGELKLPGLLPQKAMGLPYPTIRENVNEVLGLGKKWGADLIVVSSHGRKGLSRLLMGSFAETLVVHSAIPVLVVNPKWKHSFSQQHLRTEKATLDQERPKFDTILFPTDFSDQSHLVFNTVLDFAKENAKKVVLYHRVQVDISPALESAFGAYGVYRNAFDQEMVNARTLGKKWIAQVERCQANSSPASQLQGQLIIDQKRNARISDCILKEADKLKGRALIAMAGQSGTVAATFLGSVTRQVIRGSHLPVWVMHPQKIKTKRESID